MSVEWKYYQTKIRQVYSNNQMNIQILHNLNKAFISFHLQIRQVSFFIFNFLFLFQNYLVLHKFSFLTIY